MGNVEIILFTASIANVLKNRFSIGINCVGLSKEMKNEHAAYPNISINVRQLDRARTLPGLLSPHAFYILCFRVLVYLHITFKVQY